MDHHSSSKATSNQIITLCIAASLGSAFVLRNIIRMSRYSRQLDRLMLCKDSFAKREIQLERVKGSRLKQIYFLQITTPNFPPSFFSNIEDPSKYSTSVARFYQQLKCPPSFQAVIRSEGKQHPVLVQTIEPKVGFQLAHLARKLDSLGLVFHRNQSIAVLGELSYSKQSKRFKISAQMLGIDWIEIMKYHQSRLIATILSTFYFSFLIGGALAIYDKTDIKQKCQQFFEEKRKSYWKQDI